jgi:glutamine synthetase
MPEKVQLNPNHVVRYLKKPADEFTKRDIIKFVEENGIRMINFRYIAGDGRLKTLNFIINNKKHLDQILSCGERVDGSNLFSYIKASSSDLYVIPKYRTAFVDPFSQIPTLNLMCSYYTADGKPLESAPDNLVKRAQHILKKRTGMTMEALGELEFYLFSEVDRIYPIVEQKGYHESHPFSKWAAVRTEAMQVISEIGGKIKYGHAEVGNIIHHDVEMVQHEIEFLPQPIEQAADQLVLAKWAIREVAYKYGLEVSFAPKIIVGHAGSGLHVHFRLIKDGKNMMVDSKGLSEVAKKAIAGLLELAPSLTAFGNIVPTSFLRLVPHQEAPTSLCWGDRTRSVLVRVPLGGRGVSEMVLDANPMESDSLNDLMDMQTVELRSPDGSANVHNLLAGIAVAVLFGLEKSDALTIAQNYYVAEDASCVAGLKQLPASCFETAEALERDRRFYESNNVFPAGLIDKLVKELKSYKDKDLSEKLFGNADALKEMVQKYIHCG